MHDEAQFRSEIEQRGLISLGANVGFIQSTCQCYFVANDHFKCARSVAGPWDQSRVFFGLGPQFTQGGFCQILWVIKYLMKDRVYFRLTCLREADCRVGCAVSGTMVSRWAALLALLAAPPCVWSFVPNTKFLGQHRSVTAMRSAGLVGQQRRTTVMTSSGVVKEETRWVLVHVRRIS